MRSAKIRCACAIVALSLTMVSSADAQDQNRVGLIGLLFLPEVFGTARGCEVAALGEVALYSAPESADVIGWLRPDKDSPVSDGNCYGVVVNVHLRADGSARQLPVEEYREEEPRVAIVVEERTPWYKIRIAEGAAWVKPANPGNYHAIEQLVSGERSHLTHAWNGTLASEPGGPSRRVPNDPRRGTTGYVEPVLEGLRVVLQPGQDPEEIRKQYQASSMGSRPGPNGTHILSLERGTWVEAFERPDRRASVVGRFRNDQCRGALRSTSSNPPQIPVFERRPGWLQVALEGNTWRDDRRVWIEETPVWRFYPHSDDGERLEFEDEVFFREHSSVRVTGSRRISGALWLQVDVMSHTMDDSDDPPRVVAQGWVPAHDANGDLVVWFYSRD